MGSLRTTENKPHAVCIPYPAQGHVNPMLKLAKILHFKGFHITFVNSEYNHKRLLKARGPDSLSGLPSFRFETIPDGLPEPEVDATQDIPSLCESTRRTCLPHFKNLLSKLNNASDAPPITCIISDGVMSFTVEAAKELGIPEVLFWTTSACGFMCYVQYQQLVDKGLTPLKDSSYITNGYLDTTIDWVPGIKEIRLKDIPSFVRTTDPDDLMVDFILGECGRAKKASAIILNTFDALEHDVLEAFSSILPPVYSIGPLNLLLKDVADKDLNTIGSNLWKEDTECLDWLDNKEPNSVVYVNFGSITVMTNEQLVEFAWGLAKSNKTFLWVIRPDLVAGENAVLPPEFVTETKNRGLLSHWCPQEQVLAHPAIGGFLTHSGWNSTLESICGGVPMICWPFFAEQQTNCRFCCNEWGIGMEIEDVKRDKIESLVKELMDGEKGRVMKEKALEWKTKAKDAASAPDGSSFLNLDNMVRQVLLDKN
ncbi:7-deoxyloganetin glucosyltransferase-like isoform X1 [Gastrolobium bilobum]|uniref:7-deoxyloganetin glucosyltransferase-like isoform X1 n=1 Tax=Gastrolobium bilobum TaxID=150636 RepID=UPI002AB0A2E9|nr:7-deoxyloganetin glucosyltransferase-like isoform X1 [Gastrolobium bilobum]